MRQVYLSTETGCNKIGTFWARSKRFPPQAKEGPPWPTPTPPLTSESVPRTLSRPPFFPPPSKHFLHPDLVEFGRPHRDTLTLWRSLSKSIARRRNFVSAEAAYQELHASISLKSGNAAHGKFGLVGHLRPCRTLWTLNPSSCRGLGPSPSSGFLFLLRRVLRCAWTVSPLRRAFVFVCSCVARAVLRLGHVSR